MNFNKPHNSMRGHFSYELYELMENNKDIYLVTADLGYGMFNKIRDCFPERYINVGAAEQAGVGICVGLALEGKIPFFYSITNFALFRPFEWIRNYIDFEKIPVCIVGGGRDEEYSKDGFTHHSCDAQKVLSLFKNIEAYFPENKKDIPKILKKIINLREPSFLSLKR